MDRREALKLSLLAGVGLAAGGAQAQQACATDGTPAQFTPKKPADAAPLDKEFEKYPKCPYCGMDRKEHHRTRMLVQYSDDLADGTCSIHCLALSLGVAPSTPRCRCRLRRRRPDSPRSAESPESPDEDECRRRLAGRRPWRTMRTPHHPVPARESPRMIQ